MLMGVFGAMMEQRAREAMARQRYLQEVMAHKKTQHQGAILVGHSRGVFTIYAKTSVPKVER